MEPQEIAPGIVIERLSGMCPLEVEGTIDGFAFYFRARGEGASLTIDPFGAPGDDVLDVGDKRPGFHLEADFETWPNAGYMEDAQATGCIERGALVFRYLRAQGSELAWNPRAWEPARAVSPVAERLLTARLLAFGAMCNLGALLKRPRIDRIPDDVRKSIEATVPLLETIHHHATWARAQWGDPAVASPTEPAEPEPRRS